VYIQATDIVGNGKDIIDVIQILILPVVLGFMANWTKKTSDSAKRAEAHSKEAAEYTRPNGSGHSSLTALTEDIWMGMGEIKGDLKRLCRQLEAHTKLNGHAYTLNELVDMKKSINEVTERFLTYTEAQDSIYRQVLKKLEASSGD
jgi:hypothetical protein